MVFNILCEVKLDLIVRILFYHSDLSLCNILTVFEESWDLNEIKCTKMVPHIYFDQLHGYEPICEVKFDSVYEILFYHPDIPF